MQPTFMTRLMFRFSNLFALYRARQIFGSIFLVLVLCSLPTYATSALSSFLANHYLPSHIPTDSPQTHIPDEQEQKKILVFYQETDERASVLLKYLETQLTLRMPRFEYQLLDIQQLSQKEIEKYMLSTVTCAISIGKLATQKVLAVRSSVKVFSLYVSRVHLDKFNRVYRKLGVFVSGIYEEQPFERQIYLSKALDPEIEQVGILVNQLDKFYLTDYQRMAKDNKISLNYKILKTSDIPERNIKDVAGKNQVLLISNNEQLFMESKLVGTVLSAYYQQVKLIGNRVSDSKMGALASIYTPPSYLAIEVVNNLIAICKNNETPSPRYSKYFSVAVNNRIADNLNLPNYDTDEITKKISQMEKGNNKGHNHE